MPKNYTVKEVADILGYSTNSIYTFLKEKRLKGVRVGRGRFRIPEEELARVLHLSRKPQEAAGVTTSELVAAVQQTVKNPDLAGDAALVRQEDGIRASLRNTILLPNIFDWYVGTGAVVAGVALFLFNTILDPTESGRFVQYLPVMRVILIACGVGVIISGMFVQGLKWRGVFLGLLAMLGSLNAYGLLRLGDHTGAVFYGVMAATIAIALILRLGGIAAIVVYSSLIALLIPAMMLMFPGDAQIQRYVQFTGQSGTVIGALSMVVGAILAVAFWIGYTRSRALFLVACWVTALCEVLVAVWLGHYQYWSRAFFMVVLGYFTCILPYWWTLQKEASLKMRVTLHAMFYIVGATLLGAVLVVHLLQQSAWDTRKKEFNDKIQVAQNTLINAVDSVKSSTTVAAANKELVEAVKEKDLAQLTTFAKILYESNPNIRRLGFIDENGKGLTLYPYGTFDDPDYSSREYFARAKTTRKVFVTNMFQGHVDNQGRYIIMVAVPLLDAKGEFRGIMASSIDLDRLGLELAQIADESMQERFTIADANGVILSHRESSRIGTKLPDGHLIYKALKNESGIERGTMLGGTEGMTAYRYVEPLKWAISLSSPEYEIFALKSSAVWWILGTVEAVMLVTVLMFTFLHARIKNMKEGGP